MVSKDPYTYSNGGKTLYVDPQAGTITSGADTYSYRIERDSVTITYPNGLQYCLYMPNSTECYGGYVVDADGPSPFIDAPGAYIEGEYLMEAIDRYIPAKTEFSLDLGGILCGLLLCGVGLWGLLAPQTAWYVSHGWRYKDAEPSDAALAVESIGGIIAIVGGLIMIVVSL